MNRARTRVCSLPVRVCHLSWEYPPVVYGGLGRHVHALAEAQAALGHEVTVVTDHAEGAPRSQMINGVRVLRADPAPPDLPFDTEHLLAWVLNLDHRLTRLGLQAWRDIRPDVLHAHDWLVAHTAMDLQALDTTPVIATMHATEAGRHQGWLPTELSRSIHRIESWLVGSASGVITCSTHMETEVSRLFDIPTDAVTVIPNGIDTRRWSRPGGAAPHRSGTNRPLLVFCGRLEWEKGVHTLIDAVPRLRRKSPGVHVVVAGDGSRLDSLRQQARDRRVASRVEFTGWLPEPDLHHLMSSADAVVVPSIYEPFGLVALEAAALGAPLAVARTGGLAEFAGQDRNAVTFAPGDVAQLAEAVHSILADLASASARIRRARRRLREQHAWPGLAAATIEFYRQASSRRTPRHSVVTDDLAGNLLENPSA